MKNISVITSYPDQGVTHDKKTVGGASYTKNLLLEIKKIHPDAQFIVYAERFTKKTDYIDKEAQVKRIWQRNNIFSIWEMIFDVIQQKTPIVMISYEINMLGGTYANISFLLGLLLLKLAGKQIITILHQIVGDFGTLEKNILKVGLLNTFKNILYAYLQLISSKIIVFEVKFRKNLGSGPKIAVIPHAVEPMIKIDKQEARKTLRFAEKSFYVLYFGYLSAYKGVSELIDIFPQDSQNKLIIAGGSNPNHIKNKKYMAYVENIDEKAKQKNIICTGVIDESDIPVYFSACDLVILPYKMFFSSSGPLSIAFSLGKPVLLSRPLEGYFETKDFQEALNQTHMQKEDLLFEFDTGKFAQKLAWAKQYIEKLTQFSEIMKEKRNWEKIAKKYIIQL